ncbi:MAG: metal-dependent hydrolase, partial [Polyangiales bacterium]
VKTHIFNALNLLFPDGERYFVKAVIDHVSQIDDPALLREVRAFAGQEGQHAHQHERFFAVMKQQGYHFGRFVRAFRDQCRWSSKTIPAALRLSITAGSEHYTAAMAASVLELGLLHSCDATMRNLITWHAVEEIEHKHVAYDVLAKLHPNNYPLRVLGFALASASIFGQSAYALDMLLTQDKAAGRVTQGQILRSTWSMLRGEERRFFVHLFRAMGRYLVPGFHPNQKDDRALLDRFAPQIPLAAPAARAAELQ